MKKENRHTFTNQTGDEFEKIKGVGHSTAQALHSHKIERFADLAEFSAEALEQLLHSDVPFANAQRIKKEQWLEQARLLSAEQSPSGEPPTQDAPPAETLTGTSLETDPAALLDPPLSPWHEWADFFVSFGELKNVEGLTEVKTKVHYSQVGTEVLLDGIAPDEAIDWMVKEANLPIPPGPAPAERGEMQKREEPSQNIPAWLEITNLRVSRVEFRSNGAPVTTKLRVEAQLEETEPFGMEMPDPSFIVGDVLLVNTQTGKAIFHESPLIPLSAGRAGLTFQDDLTPPPSGRYRLYLLIRPATQGKLVTQQGPVLNVTWE